KKKLMNTILRNRLFKGRLFILFFLIFSLGFSQGTETFSNVPTSSPGSYLPRTWTGDNGETWNATDARTDQTINGKAITVRNGELSTNFTGGIGSLTLTTKRAFSGGSGDLTVSV